jgi:hypothetical protein
MEAGALCNNNNNNKKSIVKILQLTNELDKYPLFKIQKLWALVSSVQFAWRNPLV